MTRILRPLLLALLAGALPAPAYTVPMLGGGLTVAEDGEVIAHYLGRSAGYASTLFVEVGGESRRLFDQDTPAGSGISLGHFRAGTELRFRLHVNETGDDFLTGAPRANPDGLAHALIATLSGHGGTYVGFEDVFGGGDRDYNDLMFSFSNLAAQSATGLSLGAGGGAGGQGPQHRGPRDDRGPSSGVPGPAAGAAPAIPAEATAIPEPHELLLAGVGLLAIAGVHRYRRH